MGCAGPLSAAMSRTIEKATSAATRTTPDRQMAIRPALQQGAGADRWGRRARNWGCRTRAGGREAGFGRTGRRSVGMMRSLRYECVTTIHQFDCGGMIRSSLD
jgi:hypothetical protein